MAENADEAWLTTLDAMEADLSRNLDDEPTSAWSVPTDPGPLPEHLVDRVQRIVDAQHELIAQLTDEQATIRQHLAALDIVPSAQPSGQSVYLDVTG